MRKKVTQKLCKNGMALISTISYNPDSYWKIFCAKSVLSNGIIFKKCALIML